MGLCRIKNTAVPGSPAFFSTNLNLRPEAGFMSLCLKGTRQYRDVRSLP